MEVHHHPHVEKKSFKEYLLEGLMIFLAVSMGFIAENVREKIVENQREKEFAITLMEDLKNDTLDLNSSIPFWTKYKDYIDTIRSEIEKKENNRDLFLLYKNVAKLNTNFTFRYHDRTIMQLKAGNFRLIHSKTVSDSLVEYDAVYNTLLKNIENNYDEYKLKQMTLCEHLFSSRYFLLTRNQEQLDSAFKTDHKEFAIRKGKEDILFEYYNFLYDHRALCNARLFFLKRQQKWAISLIGLIQKEYHL